MRVVSLVLLLTGCLASDGLVEEILDCVDVDEDGSPNGPCQVRNGSDVTWAPGVVLRQVEDGPQGIPTECVRVGDSDSGVLLDEDVGIPAPNDGFVNVRCGDCADEDPARSTVTTEIARDFIDNDCDGADIIDADGDNEAFMEQAQYRAIWVAIDPDARDPNFAPWDERITRASADCDDDNPNIFTDAPGNPWDGIDSGCTGLNDYDLDGDGFFDTRIVSQADYDAYEADVLAQNGGEFPENFIQAEPGDCDDRSTGGNTNPNTTNDDFSYDLVDRDCNGFNEFDQDGDGYIASGKYAEYVCFALQFSDYPGTVVGEPLTCAEAEAMTEQQLVTFVTDLGGFTRVNGTNWEGPGGSGPQLPGDCIDSLVTRSAGLATGEGAQWPCAVLRDAACVMDPTLAPNYDSCPTTDVCTRDVGPTALSAADVHPGATEIFYDGVDQDCDGSADFDQDEDGSALAGIDEQRLRDYQDLVVALDFPRPPTVDPDDCDDLSADRKPGLIEVLGNAIDEDCDGVPDSTPFEFGEKVFDEVREPVFLSRGDAATAEHSFHAVVAGRGIYQATRRLGDSTELLWSDSTMEVLAWDFTVAGEGHRYPAASDGFNARFAPAQGGFIATEFDAAYTAAGQNGLGLAGVAVGTIATGSRLSNDCAETPQRLEFSLEFGGGSPPLPNLTQISTPLPIGGPITPVDDVAVFRAGGNLYTSEIVDGAAQQRTYTIVSSGLLTESASVTQATNSPESVVFIDSNTVSYCGPAGCDPYVVNSPTPGTRDTAANDVNHQRMAEGYRVLATDSDIELRPPGGAAPILLPSTSVVLDADLAVIDSTTYVVRLLQGTPTNTVELASTEVLSGGVLEWTELQVMDDDDLFRHTAACSEAGRALNPQSVQIEGLSASEIGLPNGRIGVLVSAASVGPDCQGLIDNVQYGPAPAHCDSAPGFNHDAVGWAFFAAN